MVGVENHLGGRSPAWSVFCQFCTHPVSIHGCWCGFSTSHGNVRGHPQKSLTFPVSLSSGGKALLSNKHQKAQTESMNNAVTAHLKDEPFWSVLGMFGELFYICHLERSLLHPTTASYGNTTQSGFVFFFSSFSLDKLWVLGRAFQIRSTFT